jgi:hypothetical protein
VVRPTNSSCLVRSSVLKKFAETLKSRLIKSGKFWRIPTITQGRALLGKDENGKDRRDSGPVRHNVRFYDGVFIIWLALDGSVSFFRSTTTARQPIFIARAVYTPVIRSDCIGLLQPVRHVGLVSNHAPSNHRLSRNHPRIIQESSQDHLEFIPSSSQVHPRMIRLGQQPPTKSHAMVLLTLFDW